MAPLTISIADAKTALGIGRTKLYELISEGQLDTIKIGRRRLVTVTSLRRLVGQDGEAGPA